MGSANLINPFMRVTNYVARHLTTLWIIVTSAVYPRLVEFLDSNIQNVGQKSHCRQCYPFLLLPFTKYSKCIGQIINGQRVVTVLTIK